MTTALVHRDGLFRRRLDAAALALFEPGEEVLATFDAARRGCLLRRLSYATFYGGLLAALGDSLVLRGLGVADGVRLYAVLVVGVTLVIRALMLRRDCAPLMVALTSHGVVVCGLDRLGRPRTIVARGPVRRPVIAVERRVTMLLDLGPLRVWTHFSVRRLLDRAAYPRPADPQVVPSS